MIAPLRVLFFASVGLGTPILQGRVVDKLDEAATAEAHVRDDTATRAFAGIEIKTSDGRCAFVDELSGDFRANLLPIQVATCDGSEGQKWDIITAGKHNDQPGTMLVVSTLTQGCMNFDPRRAAGNQVIIFSCGGRADGGGAVTNSQLFNFDGGAGPLPLANVGEKGICFTAKGDVLDQAACSTSDSAQSFTFGGNTPAPVQDTVPVEDTTPATTSTVLAPANTQAACVSTTIVTSTRFIDVTGSPPAATESPLAEQPASTVDAPATPSVTAAPEAPVSENPTTAVPVSRAGGVLQPSAAAESHQFDATATRAFTGVQVKDAAGKCLSIDPTAGDFRQNLIPVTVQDCTGATNQKWDFITAGKHNNQPGNTLVVSSLMNGCINLDLRRAAGDQVIIFSCGGRADGEGGTTGSQLFPFTAGETSIELAPINEQGQKCLVDNAGKLDQTACTGDKSQLFSIV
ncbi:hypothetical protein B0O99DRAFT_569473 [Bisporella sp. PMI_857]|nr:hypothetical protein B0O99DRAFT_569473 [Bisporella sp. PMI_857]